MKYDIYLATGWFNETQKSKMDLILKELRDAGFNVFAPAESEFNVKDNEKLDRKAAKDIYHSDIEGINNSKLVLAIYDECDSGTMMEVGYCIGINKDVVMINSESFMNLMLSVPIKGLYHSFDEAVEVIRSANNTDDIVKNSQEWRKDNF